MTSLATLTRLRAIQRRLLALIDPLDDESYRTQYHHDLSPLGWHLGHCAFIENLWLRERVQGDGRRTAKWHDDYLPERSPKPLRGPKLPPKGVLLREVAQHMEDNILLLSGTAEKLHTRHPLLADEYLENFLIQHHAQHYETMLMVLAQRAMRRHRHQFYPDSRLRAAPPNRTLEPVPSGPIHIGGERPQAFDNELPSQEVQLPATHIARFAVTNAEYLGFIESGGYEDTALWSEEGGRWLTQSGATRPEHWRRDARGWWYGIGPSGPQDLDPREPVHGVSHYEAEAYARWAGARLPHEYEWEAATRLRRLQMTGHVWEWCANTFFPYEGFEPFPYERYSKTWFDGQHYSLRGGSRYTRRDVRRPSFRNFYTADKRHIFSGFRLAY